MGSFLHSGIGYCAVKNNQIVSRCIMIYSGGERRELGLETHEKFRGLGLGSLTAALCVTCIDLGLRPEGHSRENNPASIVVAAEKVGLSDPVHYKSLFLNLADGS
ncbi:GNAT family N-acetyltransferase [Mesotoga sp.]|jgi:hypothetical protein|uniref:GNAT family N-acetyltransferase n=1 Tax=Mesotoga sp. TaxID=2053577 RepID=UPI00345E769C